MTDWYLHRSKTLHAGIVISKIFYQLDTIHLLCSLAKYMYSWLYSQGRETYLLQWSKQEQYFTWRKYLSSFLPTSWILSTRRHVGVQLFTQSGAKLNFENLNVLKFLCTACRTREAPFLPACTQSWTTKSFISLFSHFVLTEMRITFVPTKPAACGAFVRLFIFTLISATVVRVRVTRMACFSSSTTLFAVSACVYFL